MSKYSIPGIALVAVLVAGIFAMPSKAESQAAVSEWHSRVTCTTDTAGYCTQTYSHPLGVVPVIQLTSEYWTVILHTASLNNKSFRVRVMQSPSAPWANRTLTLAVSAFAPVAQPTTPPAPSPSRTSVSPSPSVTSPSPTPTTPQPPVETPDYPTAATTGVPAGTNLTTHNGSLTVTTANTVIDSKRITGNLDIKAPGVTIKNSQIDGIVVNDNTSAHYAFTIEDSTVGTSTCSRHTGGAIGTKNYTARRVKLQNFPDGFRIAGSNVTIEDSFIRLCSADPADHSDGIQAYQAGAATNILINHNVIDQTPVAGDRQTAPLFIPNDAARQGNEGISYSVTNNVLAGGSYSLVLSGPLNFRASAVTGNKIVDGTWGWGPVDVDCSKIAVWKGNIVAKYDFVNGKILSQVRTLDDHC